MRGGSIGVFLALLEVMDRIAPPYDPTPGTGCRRRAVRPLGAHAQLRRHADEPARAAGDRLLPVGSGWSTTSRSSYLNIDPAHPSPGLDHIHPGVHFLGMISPPIMLLALPGLVFAAGRVRAAAAARGGAVDGAAQLRLLGGRVVRRDVAPVRAAQPGRQRTSYLYYMVIVMPGIYLGRRLSRMDRLRPEMCGSTLADVLDGGGGPWPPS